MITLTTRTPRDLRSDADGPTAPAVGSATVSGRCKGPGRGPHNRCVAHCPRGRQPHACHHATALPPGYRRCTGDPACPILLPSRRHTTLCPYHEFAGAIQHATSERLYEQLMDSRDLPDAEASA